jgi:hypothetical protein
MADPNVPIISQSSGASQPPAPQKSPQELSPASSGSRARVWAGRFRALIFVFLCAVMGVLLVIVPWWPQWTDNALMLRYPEMRAIMASGFFRGACSGLGLLDIWIGFWEAMHYQEDEHS